MIKLLTLFLFSTLLLAQNPNVYAALGDIIYNNTDNIDKLKEIREYSSMVQKIETYTKDVKRAKKNGLAIENGDPTKDKKDYLQKIRELSKINDFFLRDVRKNFKQSIRRENSLLFFNMINSGLIDIQRNKEEIKKYYLAHSEDVNTTGVIQTFLDEDEELRLKREALRNSYISKEEIQAQKIKRIIDEDTKQQKALQDSLEKELKEKKIKIRETQKKELIR